MDGHERRREQPDLGAMHGTYLARVVSVDDPEGLSRVRVRLLHLPDTIGDQDAAVWARVAVPFAGSGRGAFFLPDVGDEVAVAFVNGDPRMPLCVGGLWSGSARAPERLGGARDRVDRYAIVGKRGSRIAMVEESEGQATISMTTPGGVRAALTQSGGGKIEMEAAGSKITVDSQGLSIQTQLAVRITASQAEVNAPQVQVNAAVSRFAGIVQCDTVMATTVVGAVYTPGAGNVW